MITALTIVRIRSILAVVMLSGIYSFLMASIFLVLDAVDVAFTEAAVGGGISTILLVGTLVHTSRDEKKPRKNKRGRVQWGALLVTIVTGAALVYGTFDMPRFGDPTAPIHNHRVPEMMNQTVAFTGHVREGLAAPEGKQGKYPETIDGVTWLKALGPKMEPPPRFDLDNPGSIIDFILLPHNPDR